MSRFDQGIPCCDVTHNIMPSFVLFIFYFLLSGPIAVSFLYYWVITPVLSTCPLHTNSGCGKERRILIGPWGPANKAALVRNYLQIYWPCSGGLLAVNAIGTQLRDRITWD